MKRSALLKVCSLCLASLVLACRTGSAPTTPQGEKIAIVVVPDRNVSGATPKHAEQLNVVGAWMEGDLVEILEKMGYAASRSVDDGVQPGPGRYVLRVKIADYNAGSAAARAFAGSFGAGAARLETHFELIGAGGVLALSGDPSVASGRSWTNCARKVNLRTADAITARLRQAM